MMEDIYMDSLKLECLKDGIDFWGLVVFLEQDVPNFYKAHNEEVQVKELLKKRERGHDESTEYLLKNILQNIYPCGTEFIKNCLEDRTIKKRNKCISFLDKIEEPYKYIYSPLFFWKTKVYSNEEFAPRKSKFTGITEASHFIAREYALFKISKTKKASNVVFCGPQIIMRQESLPKSKTY